MVLQLIYRYQGCIYNSPHGQGHDHKCTISAGSVWEEAIVCYSKTPDVLHRLVVTCLLVGTQCPFAGAFIV